MNSVGETLRRERMRLNLELDQVSKETKINLKLLEAIEAEQFERLPGGVFTRSFVRQYARLLGLDEDEIAAELETTLQPLEPTPVSDQPASPEPPIYVSRVPDWASSRPPRTGSLLPALALVVVVMLLCSAIYAWWQKTRRPSYTVQQAPAAQQQRPAPFPAPAPVSAPPAAVPENAPQASVAPSQPETGPAVQPAAPALAPTAPANPAATVRVSLLAEEPTWISAHCDGTLAYSGVLQPQQRKDLEGVERIRLVVGNAGGLSVSLNGKVLPPLGPKGQVRIVQLSSGGVQVEPPKPRAPDTL